MKNEPTDKSDPTGSTTVTRTAGGNASTEPAAMSYTAVTSKKTMAEALIRELLAHAQSFVQERKLSPDDLLRICNVSLGNHKESARLFEGRHLRSRITEQLSRADRYKESFSLLAIHFHAELDETSHDSLIDALMERMRKTDMLFTFKFRVVLLLPHTPKEGAQHFVERVQHLLSGACAKGPEISFRSITYPDASITKRSAVLDWAEDQLRS
jgi:hypothetical protein